MARKGLFSRLIEGTEKTDEQARNSLPSNRFELFWFILKDKFLKLVLINILMMLFLIPVFLLYYFRLGTIYTQAVEQPFSQNIMTGYPIMPQMQGLSESVTMSGDMFFYGLLPLAMIIGALGLSGGLYVIRNMVWTEGIFVANDFWRGIKKNFTVVMPTVFIYCIFLFMSVFSLDFVNYLFAIDWGMTWLLYVAKICVYIFMSIITIIMLYMLTMGVTYKLKYRHLIKNAFLLTFGLLPTNVIFILLALVPFLLYLIPVTFLQLILMMLIILVGLCYAMLVWTNYSQWVFDRTMNPRIEGAKTGRGMYEKAQSESRTLELYTKEIKRSMYNDPLINQPHKPIDDELDLELPASYSRKDLEELALKKEKMREEAEKYVEEHKDDEAYKQLREMKEEDMLEEAAAEKKRSKYRNKDKNKDKDK